MLHCVDADAGVKCLVTVLLTYWTRLLHSVTPQPHLVTDCCSPAGVSLGDVFKLYTDYYQFLTLMCGKKAK